MTNRPGESFWRRADIWLAGPALACMLAAELWRTVDPRRATEASMAGWLLLVAQVVWWTRGHGGWWAALAWFGRVLLIAFASLATLYPYYARSRSLEAGVHVDMVYTYIGLEWFFDLHSPITFAGSTPSYHQLPFLLLNHVPGWLFGIERMGAFAVHFGSMVEVAVLLAIAAERLVPGSLARQVLAGVLASAVFSNRLMVLSYNNAGYALPVIAFGLMLIVVAADDSPSGPDRMVGGLLALALLHHYPGWTMVLPLVAAWLVLRRHPFRRTWCFVRANPVLLTVVAVAVITMVVHPDLLTQRLRDVTRGGPSSDPLTRMRNNWSYLKNVLPQLRFQEFVKDSHGSWLLLNIPPLGGWALPIMAASWVASAIVLPGRTLRYLGLLLGVVGSLLVLTAVQHLLTDFSEYRDFPLVHAATMAGLLFTFRAAYQRGWRGAVALTLALGIAGYNWADMTALRGKRFNSYDYTPRAQAAFERLRRLGKSERFRSYGATRVILVAEDFIPLEGPYRAVLQRDGVSVRLVKLSDYCREGEVVVERAADPACDAYLVIVPVAACAGHEPIPQQTAELGLTARLYPSVCAAPQPPTRPTEPVTLEG